MAAPPRKREAEMAVLEQLRRETENARLALDALPRGREHTIALAQLEQATIRLSDALLRRILPA